LAGTIPIARQQLVRPGGQAIALDHDVIGPPRLM
jgi:hypothetical protein